MTRILLLITALLGFVGTVSADAAPQPQTATAASASATGAAVKLAEAKTAMMTDPETAARLARDALIMIEARADAPEAALLKVEAQWLRGEALGRINQAAPATLLIDKALAAVVRLAPSSKLNGDLLMSRGALAAEAGDVQLAFRSYQAAHDIFRDAREPRSQAIALQNIGSIYGDAGDQARSLKYYEQSAEVYSGDPALTLAALNNRGFALKELGEYAKAEAIFQTALATPAVRESPLLEARIMSNVAATQLLQKRYDAADRSALRGLRIARGAAAEWAPFLLGVRAQIAIARGDRAAGIALLERAFADQDFTTTNFYYRDFHEAAANAYAESGDDRRSRLHLQALKRLDDEARAIRSSTNAALMAAQFDFSNQELSISKLKAGQLERDITIQREKARRQMILLAGALAMLALALFGYFSIRRSRNRLALANTSLEKALKAKSEFLATTSHEIRTPLNGILGMTQVLLRGNAIDAETRDRIKVVHGAGETMKAVVDDILDMAKIESGRVEVIREEVDLTGLLRDIAELWREPTRDKGVLLSVGIDEAPRRIVEDGRKLRQIVFNLLSNAAKFTSEGAVSLTAATTQRDGEARLVIEVADTGIGVPADQLDAIFDSFHQVDGGTSRQFGGTGLGLAIARNLAVALGGTLSVDSRVGSGSRFTLDLPLRAVAVAEAQPRDPAAPTTLADCRVLLVEGNPLFQSILGSGLADDVAVVEAADDLDAATTLVARGRFDFVVVDAATARVDEAAGRAALAAFGALIGDARLVLLAPPGGTVDASIGAAAVVEKSFPVPALAPALSELLTGDSVKALDRRAAA